MTNDDSLNVWYGKQLVGTIYRNSVGMMGFSYSNNWRNNGFALSQQLSLDNKHYLPEDAIAHKFFVNLLPEADARLHIVRDLKISNADFELLKAIGGECAGAFSILTQDDKPADKPHYRKLTNDEFNKILKRRGQVFSFTVEKNRPRLSLAGAQDKCPIFFDGSNYLLPEDAAPSSHILKFEITGYRNIPVYEYFTTKLAQSVGLPVVDINLNQQGRDYYLLIKRYDRYLHAAKKIQRLHQEDFCQALGVGFEKKYEQDGGPSFFDCYQLIQNVSSQPIIDAENLLRWQIFNVLAGNSDGHAKNLALLYQANDQVQMAPFYDLVCTRAIERVDKNIALAVSGEFNPDKISAKHWQGLAHDCGVRWQYFHNLYQSMASQLFTVLPQAIKQFETEFGLYPALQRIQKIIIKQCRNVI